MNSFYYHNFYYRAWKKTANVMRLNVKSPSTPVAENKASISLLDQIWWVSSIYSI